MNTRLQCVPIIQVCPALTAGAPGESGCADICLFSIPRFLLPKRLPLAGPMSRGDPHNRRAIPPIGPLQDPRVHQEVEHELEAGAGAGDDDDDHQHRHHVQEEAGQASEEQGH